MTHQKTMGSHSLQGVNSNYQDNVPPRMQHQQQIAANARLQSMQKSVPPPQRDATAAPSPKMDNAAEGERKSESRDAGAQLVSPPDKRVRPHSQAKSSLSNGMVFCISICINLIFDF